MLIQKLFVSPLRFYCVSVLEFKFHAYSKYNFFIALLAALVTTNVSAESNFSMICASDSSGSSRPSGPKSAIGYMVPVIDMVLDDSTVRRSAVQSKTFEYQAPEPEPLPLRQKVTRKLSTNGFTEIRPSSDSRVIYVSSSSGNDSNSGLSQQRPKKTLAAATALIREGFPDHVLLRRGDMWKNECWLDLASGRSEAEPLVFAYYGNSGARPVHACSGGRPFFNRNQGRYRFVRIQGIKFDAFKLDPQNPSFTGDFNDRGSMVLFGDNRNIAFEDNVFNYSNVLLQSIDGERLKNISFRRNIWTGAYVKGSSFDGGARVANIYADGVDGLTFIENVFDYGGWNQEVPGAGPNLFSHNLYIQDNVGQDVIFRNNIVTRGASNGIQMRSGGLAEDNYFGRNAISLLMGYRDSTVSTRSIVRRNVVMEGETMSRGNENCGSVCSPAVWGIDVADNPIPNDYPAEVSCNVVSQRVNPNGIFSVVSDIEIATNWQYDNNVSYRWQNLNQQNTQYADPNRNLATYNRSLGGPESFDSFMTTVKSRPINFWDPRYQAKSINAYIRAGFDRQ